MTKTYKRQFVVYHTVTAAEETANEASLKLFSGVVTDDLTFNFQVQRAGVEIPGFKSTYTSGTGVFKIEDAGAVSITENDNVVIFATFK